MRITATILNEHLEEIAKQLNLSTSQEQAIEKKQDKFLYLEYASVYGGYRLINVKVDSGAHCGAFGGNGCEARISAKQMYAKLDAILDGIVAVKC